MVTIISIPRGCCFLLFSITPTGAFLKNPGWFPLTLYIRFWVYLEVHDPHIHAIPTKNPSFLAHINDWLLILRSSSRQFESRTPHPEKVLSRQIPEIAIIWPQLRKIKPAFKKCNWNDFKCQINSSDDPIGNNSCHLFFFYTPHCQLHTAPIQCRLINGACNIPEISFKRFPPCQGTSCVKRMKQLGSPCVVFWLKICPAQKQTVDFASYWSSSFRIRSQDSYFIACSISHLNHHRIKNKNLFLK